MSATCPPGFPVDRMRGAVEAIYTGVATNPDSPFHFNVGGDYAVSLLHYDRSEIDALPRRATARFAGTGNPHRAGTINEGETVVDIGSGGGTDLLMAARRVGPKGRVIGVDPTAAMRAAAWESVVEAGAAGRVSLVEGRSESIPLPDAAANVVISNGVLNLSIDKRRSVQEIFRVLAPGGRVYLADVFLDKDLKESERLDADLWAGCVAGALQESELIALALEAGFENPRIVERYDCFQNSRVERKVASVIGVHGATFCAQKRQGVMMNPNKALWEKGDFTEIASLMRESGEALVKPLGITPQLRILDLGCGDGTTAVPMARLGAEVLGIDIARNLVEAGNKRASTEGLSRLRFQEGDAINLEGIADRSFDLTLSIFGAMFAPKPVEVAKEMVRVTKPGGRIVMGNWIPNDPTSFVSQLLKISSSFTPPPPEGFISPMMWGVEAHILDRFGQAGIPPERISMVKDVYHFIAADRSPAQIIDAFQKYYGPTMNAFEAAEKNGKAAELRRQLDELAMAQNTDRGGGTAIPATFMRVTVNV